MRLKFWGQTPRMGHTRADLTPLPLLFWTVGIYLIIYRAEETPVEIVAVTQGRARGTFRYFCSGVCLEGNETSTEIFEPALPRVFHAARVQRGDLANTWVRMSCKVGGRLTNSLLANAIQRDGNVDLVLRCAEDEWRGAMRKHIRRADYLSSIILACATKPHGPAGLPFPSTFRRSHLRVTTAHIRYLAPTYLKSNTWYTLRIWRSRVQISFGAPMISIT